MSATKRNSRYAMADMLKSTKSLSSMPSKKKKQSTHVDEDVPVMSPDDRILVEQTAVRQNQAQISDIAEVLRSLVTMAEEEDLKVPSSERPTATPAEDGTTKSSVEVMQNIMVGVKNRRGDYVNTIARSEGSLSLGPALHHRQIDRRIAECVSLLCKISPSTNDDVQYVGHILLVANPAESLEAIYHRQLKSSTEIYSGVRELCSQIGDIIARVQDTQDTGRSSNDLKAQTGFNITALTPMLRRSVREVRDAIASQVVIGSASLDLCCVLRKSMEELEQDNRSLQYAKMVLTRQLREAYLDNVVIRSELHDKFLSSRQAEIQANARMNTAMKKSAHPKVLVMCQIENTYSRKLHRPRLFSEALMEVLHWMDMKLPVMQGKRVNYNSALEPKEIYDVESNPILPPESYFLEFPSIGPAIEFCVALQQDMALAIDWPTTLLKIPCFEEVKDGLHGGDTGGEESALQRSRRMSHQRPVWNGLRIRAAIHIGLPYVTHPFRGASPIFALPNAASKPEADITPEDVPHLMGMAVDATMQLLKKARGGEILISAKASEAYDALKFQHPDSFTNVVKIAREYSGNKGVPGKGTGDEDKPFSQDGDDDEDGDAIRKDLSMVPSGSMIAKPALERQLSDHSFTGKTFVRPCDRLYAVISHLLKSREETFYPYHYNEVSEVVFPPTAWWRSTDAQSSNLSLFASIGGKAEDMPSDMEDLSGDEEEYIPPDAVEDPSSISVSALQMAPPLGGFGHVGGGGGGEEGGGRMSVSFFEKSDPAASTTRGSTSSGGGGKKKRRTAAEYESELERLYSQVDGLNAKCRQQDEIKSMFAEEIQLLQSKNQSLIDNLNSTKKALAKSKKRHETCAHLLTETSKSVMDSEEMVSNLAASNEAFKAKIKSLHTEMDDLDTRLSVSIASQRESVQKSALMSNRLVNGECQTGPDPNVALEAARGDILEKALRWSISLLSLSSQHIEVITHPSSTSTATGNMAYKRSIVTSDLHKKVTSFLEDPTVAAAIATVDDRFEPLGSMKLVSDKSRTKSNRVDDLVRTVRKFHTDHVGIEKERPDDPFAKTISPVIVSKKSVGGNDYDTYDWSASLGGLTIYETLRHAAGHVLKGVTDVMSFDQLLHARHQKVQTALTRAVESKDDATLSTDVSMVIARHLRGADGVDDGISQLTSPTSPTDMSFTAQRARDAEGKVKDQSEVILQYRTELARTGKEIEEVRVAREVEQLRAEVMYGKLKEVNAVLNGLRETIIAAVAKIHKEIPNASHIKSKIMSTGGPGGVSNGSSSNLAVSVSISAAEQEANMEFLISKVLSDLQSTLGSTVVDFCTQAGNAAPLSSRRNNSTFTVGSGLGGSTQGDNASSVGDGDAAEASLGDLSILSSSNVMTSPNMMRPTGGIPTPRQSLAQSTHNNNNTQRERTISNVITHDIDLATIMYRSKNELEMSATLPEGISPLKQLTQIELLEKDRHRLQNLQKQFDSRMERIKEKEKNRVERDAQLQTTDWGVVIEKQYKREKYLLDQVRHLLKRRAAAEQSQKDTQRGRMERSSQTTILAEHRMFKKHDEAIANGVDEAEEEHKLLEAKRDVEFQALLANMRRAEREQQTDMSCFARRSCKVQTRRRATDFVDDEEDEDYCISIDSEFEVSDEEFGFMNSPPSSPSHSESVSTSIKSERKRQSLIRTKLRNFRKTRGGKTGGAGGGPTEDGGEETVNKLGRKTKNIAVMTTPRLGAGAPGTSTSTGVSGGGGGSKGGHRTSIGSRQNLTQTTSTHSITNPTPISRPTQSKVHSVNLLGPASEASGGSSLMGGSGARTPIHNNYTSPDTSMPPSKTASSHKFLKRGDKSTSSLSSIMSAKAAAKKLATNAKSKSVSNIGSSSSSASGGGTGRAGGGGGEGATLPRSSRLLDIDSDNDAPLNPDDSSMSDQDRSAILAFGSGASLLDHPVVTQDIPPTALIEKEGSIRSGGGLPSIPDISGGSASTRPNTASALSINIESVAAESDAKAESSMRLDSSMVVRSALSQSQSLRIAEPTLHAARGRFDNVSGAVGLRGDIVMNGDDSQDGNPPTSSDYLLEGEDESSSHSQANPDLPDAFPTDTSIRYNRSTMGSASGRPRTPLIPGQIVSTQRQFGDSLTDTTTEEVPGLDHGSFAAMQDSLMRVVEDKVSTSPSKPHQRNRLAGRVFTPQAQVQGKVDGRGPTMVPFLLEPPKELEGQYTMHTQQFDLSHLDASTKNSKTVAYAQLLQDLSQNPELRKEMEGVQKGVVARRLYESKVQEPSSPSHIMSSSTPLNSRPLSGLDPSSSYYRHSVSSILAVPTSTGGKIRVRAGTVTSLDHTKLTPKDQQLFQHPAVGNEEFARRHKSFSEENYEHTFERRNSPPQSPLDASILRPLRNTNGSIALEPNVHGRAMVHVAPQTAPSFASEPILVPAGRVHTNTPPPLGKRSSSTSTNTPPILPSTTSPIPTKLTPIPKEALKDRLTSAANGRETRSFSLVQRKTELGIGGKQQ